MTSFASRMDGLEKAVAVMVRVRRQALVSACAAACMVLLVLANSANAEVYKWKLPDGSIEYSDTPSDPNAVRVDLPQLQLYSAPPPPRDTSSDSTDEAPERFTGYESVKIVLPANDATFRDNGGVISVQASVVPSVNAQHRVEMLFDGKVVGQGLSVTLRNVVRGTHSVAVLVKDSSGRVVARSDPVSFHVKRTFRN